MIVSSTAGRIRVRSNRLKNQEVADSILEEVQGIEGVKEVRSNPIAGSLIVGFDVKKADLDELERQLEALCIDPVSAAESARTPFARNLDRATDLGMLATLGAVIYYGFGGGKKNHIMAGLAFLALFGVHLGRHRDRFLQ